MFIDLQLPLDVSANSYQIGMMFYIFRIVPSRFDVSSYLYTHGVVNLIPRTWQVIFLQKSKQILFMEFRNVPVIPTMV